MAQVHLTSVTSAGVVINASNALGVEDSSYTGNGNTSDSWVGTWSFGVQNPGGGFAAVSATGQMKVRKGSNSGNPEVTQIELLENGVVMQSLLASPVTVTSQTAQAINYNIDQSLLTAGREFALRITTTAAGGSPSARNAVELDFANWDIQPLGVFQSFEPGDPVWPWANTGNRDFVISTAAARTGTQCFEFDVFNLNADVAFVGILLENLTIGEEFEFYVWNRVRGQAFIDKKHLRTFSLNTNFGQRVNFVPTATSHLLEIRSSADGGFGHTRIDDITLPLGSTVAAPPAETNLILKATDADFADKFSGLGTSGENKWAIRNVDSVGSLGSYSLRGGQLALTANPTANGGINTCSMSINSATGGKLAFRFYNIGRAIYELTVKIDGVVKWPGGTTYAEGAWEYADKFTLDLTPGAHTIEFECESKFSNTYPNRGLLIDEIELPADTTFPAPGTPISGNSEQSAEVPAANLNVVELLSIPGTSEQGNTFPTVTLKTALPLSASSDQAAEVPAANLIGAIKVSGNSDQGHEVPAASLQLGNPISGTSQQSSDTDATLKIGVPLSGLVSTNSGDSGTLVVGVLFSGTVDQGSQSTADLRVGGALSGASDQGTNHTATLKLGITLSASSDQDSDTLGTLGISESIAISGASEQGSETSTPKILHGPQISGTLEQDSESVATLRIGLPLTGASEQDTDFEARLYDPMSFESVMLFRSEFDPATLRFAGELKGAIEQEAEITATLGLDPSILGRVDQESEIVGRLGLSLPLSANPIETDTRFFVQLRVPALNSTGWLTATDIFLHNAYWESVTVSKITASDIRLEATLRLDVISIKPE